MRHQPRNWFPVHATISAEVQQVRALMMRWTFPLSTIWAFTLALRMKFEQKVDHTMPFAV